MRRPDSDILDDIADAVVSIHSHLEHGPLSLEILLDAVAMRLLEIGEAVKSLAAELTDREPEIPWSKIAGMRDCLRTTTSRPPRDSPSRHRQGSTATRRCHRAHASPRRVRA